MSFLSPRRRRALAGGILVLALGAAGVSTNLTGAWFTSSVTAPATVTGALLSIGEIGETSDQTTIAVADVYPMTDAQALANASGAQARSEWVTVRNTGTIPLDWSLQVVNPQAKSPLTASQLAMFRFQLFTEAGVKLSEPLTFGSRPTVAVPGAGIASGVALAAGSQSKVEIRVWLDTTAGNEFQGSEVTFDVVINALQNGGERVPSGLIVLAATSSGSPRGSSTSLSWTDASTNVREAGLGGSPVYTVERSSTADFALSSTVYTGSGTSAIDSLGGRAISSPAATKSATMLAESSGWGLYAAQVDSYVRYWGYIFDGANPSPLQATGFPVSMKKIAIDYGHICGITDTEVYCAGKGADGVLGDGSDENNFKSTAVRVKNLPVPSGTSIVDVAVTIQSSCVLRSDGVILCWGRRTRAGIGDGTRLTTPAYSPVQVAWSDSAHPALSISAGRWGTYCAAKANGVACWGNNDYGLAGQLNTASVATPTDVVDPNGYLRSGVTSLDIGKSSCAVANGGHVYCWGQSLAKSDSNWDASTHVTIPVSGSVVDTGAGAGFTTVASGAATLCALRETLEIVCWPWSTSEGKDSVPDLKLASVPSDTSGVLAGASSIQLSAGAGTTCARTNLGAVGCWGDNSYGGLGVGTTRSRDGVVALIVDEIPVGGSSQKCDTGAVVLGTNCSLVPSRTYYYRVSYTVQGLPGWVSPSAVTRRD